MRKGFVTFVSARVFSFFLFINRQRWLDWLFLQAASSITANMCLTASTKLLDDRYPSEESITRKKSAV